MRQRILVVAKDMALRGRLARALKSGGYAVELAESPAHARRIGLRGFALSLVALDGLGPDAKSFLGELETNAAKPLLIGADGSDGFRFSDDADLLARIAEALRPVAEADAPEPVLRFDRYQLDIAGYALTDETGLAIPLTRGEFSLLREFVRRPGRVLSRDQLLNSLAGRDAESYDRSIDMLMVRLRRKIEADPKRPSLIVTIPGLGYKFTAKVTIETAIVEPSEAMTETSAVARSADLPAAPERRQLTILFCDLVESTALSARLDPEDLRTIITAYHRCCSNAIRTAGGEVAQLLGDGVLAYFGYPMAHELDAERAIRVGLNIIESLRTLDTGHSASLHVRIGIATGLVVVGGSANEPDYALMATGETTNLAAKLCKHAPLDSIAVLASTRRLVGGLFTFRELDPLVVESFQEPIAVWQVAGEGTTEGRYEALRGQLLLPLVGREEELAVLLRRWEQAKAGDGKVVLITGEAGIGKSRLVRAFQDAITGQGHVALRLFCSPHHQDSALHPAISQLEHAAGFAREDTDETRLSKLEAVLAQSDATNEAVALIAELLSIPTDQRERIQQMSPHVRRERTLGALLAQLAGLAARKPVLVIYEDAHWIDPTSRELLDRTIDQLEHLPVLLLATFRPEFQPPRAGQPHVSSLGLPRLDRSETATMIAAIEGANDLPPAVAEEIAERTDGVPLFIEEVTKAILEAGADGVATVSTVPLAALSVPATLQASLIARFDRLGPAAKDVVQRGAVIGREFAHELIASITDLAEPQLREALDRLTKSGLLFIRGTPPQAIYTFKHALVQEAAYGLLLRGQRRQLHARVAATLEGRFPEIVAAQPALLGQHCTEAGLTEKAIEYWLAAGRQAVFSRCTMAEAVTLLHKGLALLPGLPDGALRDQHEFGLQAALGVAHVAAEGQGAPVVREVLARALGLCNRIDPSKKFLPTWGLFGHHLSRGDIGQARELAAQIRHIGEVHNDCDARLVGWYASGVANFFMGEFASARGHLEKGLGLLDPAWRTHLPKSWAKSWGSFTHHLANQKSAQLGGWLAPVNLLGCLSSTLAISGYLEQSRSRGDAALADGRRSSAFTLAYALGWLLAASSLARSAPALQFEYADELLALAAEHGFPSVRAHALMFRGQCLVASGHADQAFTPLVTSLSELRDGPGDAVELPQCLTLLAAAHRRIGQPEQALTYLDEAERFAKATQIKAGLAMTLLVRAEILAQMGNLAGAETSLQDAIALARRQGAKLFELRAGASLARLWHARGRGTQAYDLLAPVYNWFTEGFDAPDLIEAKALLDELQAQSASAGSAQNRQRSKGKASGDT